MKKKNIIYLTGFMAAGKSTVGPIMANTIGWDFFDLDAEIEEKEGMKVKEIFKKKGETFFRKAEHEMLNHLSGNEESIISLGGGSLLNPLNLDIVKQGFLIYLFSSPEMIYRRVRFKRDRPALLYDGDDEPSEEEYLTKIRTLMKEREEGFSFADLKFDTDKIPVGKTVDSLVQLLKRKGIITID